MQRIEEYKIDTEFGRIAVKERRGGSIPILLLHGSGFSKEVFGAQFGDPALSGFRLIAIDLPGHGQSDDPVDAATTYTIRGLASVVASTIEELGISGCIVAGWSLGGHVAIELLGAHCQIAGIATFGTPPLPHGALGMVRGFHFSLDMLLASKAHLSYLEARKFERLSLGWQSDGRFVETILRTDERLRPAIARDMFSGKGCDQLRTVQSSPVPVCLIQGDHDPLVRTGYVCTLRGPSIHEGGCHVIENAGHAPFMEQPEAFDALLARFAHEAATGTAPVAETPRLRKTG
ncbi:MAG: alpha/beta hydrolase [Oricola sp.]